LGRNEADCPSGGTIQSKESQTEKLPPKMVARERAPKRIQMSESQNDTGGRRKKPIKESLLGQKIRSGGHCPRTGGQDDK